MPIVTTADVQNEAPDKRSVTAAKKVAKPDIWSSMGRDAKILWGHVVGSADTYAVYVDVAHHEFECSCPSRKRPCKHTLGLMWMEATNEAAIPDAPVPESHKYDAEQRYADSWE